MQIDNIEQRILAFEQDAAWIDDVMAYTHLDAETIADFLGCFFLDRKTEATASRFASWSDSPDYEKKRTEVMRARVGRRTVSLSVILSLKSSSTWNSLDMIPEKTIASCMAHGIEPS
jgi:hypothetical protein